ncbi:formylglycine-generating enzyme family protein [Tateyamaria sp. SN6-1]|uniref:formylglycine-generating enzyme family protein n=1 Tax=Tateyamaria sp. SN6-1 TaxID=3092148 RepID=UPI0039F488EA
MTQTEIKQPCCTPPRGETPKTRTQVATDPAWSERLRAEAASIPGGRALVGVDTPLIPNDGEAPQRRVKVKPFRIGRTAVTNAAFAAFVDATGYVTEADRFGWSFVFWAHVPDAVGPTQALPGAEWWRQVDGANWRDINGPGTADTTWHAEHPVVQVSWNDARAYADWAGGRLPTEAEWEHAARGGLGDVRFPWGDAEPNDTDHFPCNIWQGVFPQDNTGGDGHLTTAPAQSFAPNGFGLFNMVGNVWEWTADRYRIASLKKEVKARLAGMQGYRLTKGGSFLCHASYCYRYRIAARSGTSPDSASPHQGFRVVWSDP